MKQSGQLRNLAITAIAATFSVASFALLADETKPQLKYSYPGCHMGPGMMGGGYGMGPSMMGEGYHMGPEMMGGYGMGPG